MTGASTSDVVAASRWVRQRVVLTLFAAPDAAADATPLSSSGWLGGPLLALAVAAGLLWGDSVVAWAAGRF